jgi:phosphoribosylformylglycinamidine synthase subunit PurQ / glutaminase
VKSAVIVFPASNRDRDAAEVLEKVIGKKPYMVWHTDSEMPNVDLIVIPGGFSYGDYLRCGAMAAQSRIMRDVIAKAGKGVAVLGICNGFQILTESHLLPGALMRNAGLKFVSKPVPVEVEETQSMFTRRYKHKQRVVYPVAHGEGNYFADEETLNRLEGEGRVVFRYADGENPNGSARDIAGILSEKRNVMGLMPHPECACDPLLGPPDGLGLFEGLVEALS